MLPKWLEEFLQAVQIFEKVLPIANSVAQTFGPKSAATESVVNAMTKDPSIPTSVQNKVSNLVNVHLQAISTASAVPNGGKPVTSAAASSAP